LTLQNGIYSILPLCIETDSYLVSFYGSRPLFTRQNTHRNDASQHNSVRYLFLAILVNHSTGSCVLSMFARPTKGIEGMMSIRHRRSLDEQSLAGCSANQSAQPLCVYRLRL